MTNVQWLEKEEVLAIHEKVVRDTGEPVHVLSNDLLESALARPLNLEAYSSPSTYDLAASYAEGIARNHAFENGNKRTAFLAAATFLVKNGIELADEIDNEHTAAVENLSQGIMSREDFARHLEAHSQKLEAVQEKSTGNWADDLLARARQRAQERPGDAIRRSLDLDEPDF